jgi:DNA-binding Lrp family transcriptional regulator
MALDRIDFEILAALQNNARLANKELAARLGLAPSTCLVRVRRLVQAGALRGFRAEVDPKALGIGLQALIFVRLVRHSRRTVDAFRKHALSLRETIGLYHVAGQHDFLVHVGVRDADHLRDLGLDAFTTRKEVARLETHLIFEHTPSKALPLLLLLAAPGGGATGAARARSRAGRAPGAAS